jgi:hypothetical protein
MKRFDAGDVAVAMLLAFSIGFLLGIVVTVRVM